MKRRNLFFSTLSCSLALFAGEALINPSSTASASEIPHLRKQGTATQLIVDGKPFLALAGELSNNGATSRDYMKPIWARLVEAKLNTVLAGVSWAQIEPQEGKFDFSVLDGVIRDARSHNLRLVLLWFATLEERVVQLPARLAEEGFRAVPARPDRRGQEHRIAQPLSAMPTGTPTPAPSPP